MDQSPEQMLEQLASAEHRADRRLRTTSAIVWLAVGAWMIVNGVILDVLQPGSRYWVVLQATVLPVFLLGIYLAYRIGGVRPSGRTPALFPFWLPALAIGGGQLVGKLLGEAVPAINNTLGGILTAAGLAAVAAIILRPKP